MCVEEEIKMADNLYWIPGETPEDISRALIALSADHPLSMYGGRKKITFRKSDFLSVENIGQDVVISCNSLASALRGVGLALAGLTVSRENCCFHKFGIMLDSSRNAVMTLAAAKSFLHKMALCGYNMVMLYTEDTYLLQDEPHFGVIRGGFSFDEIRELDDEAEKLGIELVGCIQTLGHLRTFLRTSGASAVRDTNEVLLAEEEKTYDLIKKMLDFWNGACRSRKIHIGMDETHDLGRGKYLDKHGWKRGFDIFNSHLQKVSALCRKVGLEAMIWSDMYFRMGSSTGDYYDPDAKIPPDVREQIPEDVQLVYWDYYHLTEDIYDKMIRAHEKLGKKIVVGSGLWTWYRLCYDHSYTVERVEPCIRSCCKNGITDFFFTMWGDDGAYCGFDSALAGLIWGAEVAYGSSGKDAGRLELFANALGCKSWKQAVHAAEMNYSSPLRDNGVGTLSILMWDDPILGIGWRHLDCDEERIFSGIESALIHGSSDLPDYPYEQAAGQFLLSKIRLRKNLEDAWKRKDLKYLHELRVSAIPDVLQKLSLLEEAFRKQWTAYFRFNGMESIQLRFGGLAARFRELALRIKEMEEGSEAGFPELEIRKDHRCDPVSEKYSDFSISGI